MALENSWQRESMMMGSCCKGKPPINSENVPGILVFAGFKKIETTLLGTISYVILLKPLKA